MELYVHMGIGMVTDQMGLEMDSSLKTQCYEDDDGKDEGCTRNICRPCCSRYGSSAFCVFSQSGSQEQLVKRQVINCQIICQILERERERERKIILMDMQNIQQPDRVL